MNAHVVATHQFDQADLLWFASVSGDTNPIHVDPVAARRLLAGNVVVHGMFTVLWALNTYFQESGDTPAGIRVNFHRPLPVGEPFVLIRQAAERGETRLSVLLAGELAASMLLSPGGYVITGEPQSLRPVRMEPESHKFEDLRGAAGRMSVTASPDDISSRFSCVASRLGALPVASLMSVSRLIGMHCPGLHSLFAALELRLEPALCTDNITWRVTRHTVPHAPLRVSLSGGGLAGQLDVFFRPAPVAQPSMAEVLSQVEPGAFKGQVALVVGGSRGLGELTAKIVAAGGGRPIVTYVTGGADARRVADEIIASGRDCKVMPLDVSKPLDNVVNMLPSAVPPTHLYYFAAPQIRSNHGKDFNSALYRSFDDLFVGAFVRLVTSLSAHVPAGLRVFYPSSVFLDELPREYREYVTAKAAGEAICRHLARHTPGLQILVRRLPRLPTDQTAGLIHRAMHAPIPEILGVVRDLHAIPPDQNL